MNTVLIIIGIITAIWCAVSNIYITRVKSAKEMQNEFIDGQCFVGKVFANIFYAPAWLLKGLRFLVIETIK